MAGIINKIRARVGLVIAVIGLAMAAFILTDVLSNVNAFMGGGNANTLAEVNGQQIEYPYFEQRVNYEANLLAQIQQQQPDMQQLQGQVYDEIIREAIYQEQFSRLNIGVPKAEWLEMFTGPNPDPLVRQYFGPNPQQVINSNANDPRLNALVEYLRKALVDQRKQQRFMAFMNGGVQISKAEARRAYLEERTTAEAQVLVINYGTIQDSVAASQLTDQDYIDYYEENKERFRQSQATATLEYFPFFKRPTASDSAKTRQQARQIAREFAQTQKDSSFAAFKTNLTESMLDYRYKALTEFAQPDQELLEEAEAGEVLGPVMRSGRLVIHKVNDRSTAEEDQKVYVRHILVPIAQQDTAGALQRANAYLDSLEAGKDFQELARQVSADQQTRQNGGLIGWLDRRQYGPAFYEEVQGGEPGELVGPVQSAQGFHIVKVENRTDEVFRVATIGYEFRPSAETLDSLERQSGMLLSEVAKGTDFTTAIEEMGIKGAPRVTNPPISPSTRQIPGLQGEQGIRDLVRWAMEGEESATPDSYIETDNAFVVAKMIDRSDDEYQSVKQVRRIIEREVINRKKAEMIMANLQPLMEKGNLQEIKEAYGSGAILTNPKNITFNNPNVQGVGREPAVLGAIFGLKEGNLSAPIEGNVGVYVVLLNKRTEPEEPTEEILTQYRNRLEQQQEQQFPQRVQQGLREAAQIRDYRYNFGM